MSYTKPFDVETTMPSGNYSDQVKRTIKSINLMCFLLENVTYNQLYSDPFGYAIGEMVKQARLLNDPANNALLNVGAYSGIHYPIRDLMVTALEDIQGYVDSAPQTKLGNLFTAIYSAGSVRAERKILVRLNELYQASMKDGNCELTHFCCPFRFFQQRGKRLEPPQHLEDFLNVLGDKRMVDLYTEKKTDYVKEKRIQAIRDARNRKILIDHSSRFVVEDSLDEEEEKTVELFGSDPVANGLTCDNGTCKDLNHPNDWCNSTSNGSCSAASSP